jgi:molecular chaperone DnaK (HSP70)
MGGTLAIDLGSSTTVVAYQAPGAAAQLLALPPYSNSEPVVVPTLLWLSEPAPSRPLIGRQVLEAGLADGDGPELHRDFKRQIGAAPAGGSAAMEPAPGTGLPLSPELAGALVLRQLWAALPADLEPQRLVLTAPIDSYLRYRQWLQEVCSQLAVPELALVDEPTAAAIGAGLPAGSTVLVVDLGGGTIDLSLVALEGGEGRPAPMAQLLRFAGRASSGSAAAAAGAGSGSESAAVCCNFASRWRAKAGIASAPGSDSRARRLISARTSRPTLRIAASLRPVSRSAHAT